MEPKENLTKEYIYGAFKKLLETKNYNDISVCDITEKAGVSRMSFYRNFKSKDDLLYQGCDRIFGRMKNECNALPNINIYSITKIIFETFKNFKSILYSLEQSEVSKHLLATIPNKLKENSVTDYMNKTSKYIPVFYYGAISTVLFDWIRNGTEEKPEEMAKLIASLINFDINDSHC